jgi:hypothetical protein
LEDRIVPTAHWYLVAQAPQTNYEGDAVSLTVAADNEDGDPVNLAISGLPSGLNMTYSDIYGQITGAVAPGASAGSPYLITVAATDTVTNVTTSETIDWTVNQTIVTLTSPGDQTNIDGQPVGIQVNASDTASHPVVYSATGLPSGLTIDPSTGIIQSNIANNASLYSPYSTTVTATDTAAGVSASQTVNWTVSPPTVTLASPGDQLNLDGDAVDLTISASDSVGNALTYTATNLPSGLSIDSASGVISGTITYSADTSSPYSVTVTATDGTASVSASQTFTWTVSPQLVVVAQGDQYNLAGDSVNASLVACDTDSGALSFTATGLPSGLSIDSSSGTISGTIAYGSDASSPYAVTVTATDATSGATSSQSFSWNVSPFEVDLICPTSAGNVPGDTVNDAPIYAATSDGSALTFTASGLPSGLNIDSSTGTIYGTIDSGAASASPYDVTVTATQASAGVSATQTIAWSVSAMLLTPPGDQADVPGDVVSLSVGLTDGAGSSPTFSATGLPSGLGINSSTGVITGTIASDAVSSTPDAVTVTATDGSASASQSFNWSVQSIILNGPGNQYNADGDSVSVAVTAKAVAGDSISYTATGLPGGLSMNASTGVISGTIASNADAGGLYAVVLTATDTTASISTTTSITWTVSNSTTYVNMPAPAAQGVTLADIYAGLANAMASLARDQAALVVNNAQIAGTTVNLFLAFTQYQTNPTTGPLLNVLAYASQLSQLQNDRNVLLSNIRLENRDIMVFTAILLGFGMPWLR